MADKYVNSVLHISTSSIFNVYLNNIFVLQYDTKWYELLSRKIVIDDRTMTSELQISLRNGRLARYVTIIMIYNESNGIWISLIDVDLW